MQQETRNPVLGRLDALVGEWEFQASVGGQPAARGHTTFEWLDDGAFLVQRADAEPPTEATPPEWVANSPFPVTTIIGLDELSERFCYAYADARGVCRVYQMSLNDGVWKIWGQAGPEFFQRFTGRVSDGGNTITARWEASRDGSSWDTDFDLTYTKVK
jgi:hypothetical protein